MPVSAIGFPIGRDYSGETLENFVGQVQKFKKIHIDDRTVKL